MTTADTDARAARRHFNLPCDVERRPTTDDEGDEQARRFAAWRGRARAASEADCEHSRELHRLAVHNQVAANALWRAVNLQYESAASILLTSPGSFAVFEDLEALATDLVSTSKGCEAVSRRQREAAHRRTLSPHLQDDDGELNSADSCEALFNEADEPSPVRLAWLTRESFFRALTADEAQERDGLLECRRLADLAAAEADLVQLRPLVSLARRMQDHARTWAERLGNDNKRPDGKRKWIASADQAARDIGALLNRINREAAAAVSRLSCRET